MIKGYKTISAILGDYWLINPNYAMAHLEMIANLVDGKFSLAAPPDAANSPALPTADANIGVLSITGPVFKYDGMCGEPGYLTYGSQFDALENDENVDVIVLVIDCPGGQGNGLRTLAQKIANSTKYTIAFIDDGLCCSAAYWLASQCKWIIASQPTDRVGSIGAYMILVNFIKASENDGVPVIEVYSSLSPEKNLSVREAMQGRPEMLIKELDGLVLVFHGDVATGRAGKLNLAVADPFKGADYMAISPDGIDALSIGLIDEVGSFDLVLQRAAQQAFDKLNNPNMPKFTNLESLATVPGEKVDQNLLNKINAELTVAGITNFGVYPESVITEAANTTAQLATATTRITELEGQLAAAGKAPAELATANTRITELEGQLTAAGKAPAELATANQTIATLNTTISTQAARITQLETNTPAPGKKPLAKGGDPVGGGAPRELYSWEKKAQKLSGGAID